MYDLRMTNPHAFSSPLRLRPGSPRALNQLRLLWLLGWTSAAIAAHFGVNRTTIWRRLKTHGLNGPEKPDERETLAEAEARDDDRCPDARRRARGEGTGRPRAENDGSGERENAARRDTKGTRWNVYGRLEAHSP
jgi:hypothetical protein